MQGPLEQRQVQCTAPGAGLGLLEQVWCEGALVAISAFCCEADDLVHLHVSLSPVPQLCVRCMEPAADLGIAREVSVHIS